MSVRLDEDLVRRLQREQQIRQLHQSDLVRQLIEEALRMRECPGIVFVDSPTGRQAVVAGTGLAVWEVILVDREVNGDTKQVLNHFPHLTERDVRNARAYAQRYPQEIEAAIELRHALDERRAREEYPHLFHDPEPSQP